MDALNSEQVQRLQEEKNIWLATVRTHGKPHLVPIWFVYFNNRICICIEPDSVKGRNLQKVSHASLALEDGSHPLICEGNVRHMPDEIPVEINDLFKQKYGWDISQETQYTQLIEIIPNKWLSW
jgi:pyridoxine/pyridoxamine 5'-phosphate oxidase